MRFLYKNGLICFFIGIMFLTLFTGCGLIPKEEAAIAPPPIEVPVVEYETVTAKKQTIQTLITVRAVFVSVTQQSISFKSRSGYIKGIYVKKGDKVAKGKLLAELDSDSMAKQVELQKISVQIADIDYQTKLSDTKTSEVDRQRAELNLKSEKIKLDDVQSEMEKTKIYSTVEGEVISLDDKIKQGDKIDTNVNFITIADPKQVNLQYIDEKKSSGFLPGSVVSVDYNQKTYNAKVVMSDISAPADASDDTKKIVYFKFDKMPDRFFIGDGATITYIKEKKENVIVLPKKLVSNYKERNYVSVVENNVKIEKDIQIGMSNDSEIEVVAGITEGEKIVLK